MNPLLIGTAGAIASGHLQVAALLALLGMFVPRRLVPLAIVLIFVLLLR